MRRRATAIHAHAAVRPPTVLAVVLVGLLATDVSVTRAQDDAHAEATRLSTAIRVELEIARLTREQWPDGDNGWPDLAEAFRRAAAIHERFRIESEEPIDYQRLLAGEPGTEREEEALLALDAHGVFELLDEGLAQPRIVRSLGTDDLVIFERLDHVAQLRSLRAALRVRARRAAAARDERGFAQQIGVLLSLGRVLASQPSLVEDLVGQQFRWAAHEEIRHAVRARLLTARQSRRLAGLLGEDAHQPPLALTWRIERLKTLHLINQMYAIDETGDGVIDLDAIERLIGQAPASPDPDRSPRDALRLFATRLEMIEAIDRIYDPIISRCDLLPFERAALPAVDFDALVESLGLRYHVLTQLAPSPEQTRRARDWNELSRIAALAILALETHRIEHGAFPSALPARMTDPYSGEPLHYARTDGGYRLYSVGADGTDDDGRSSPDRPRTALDPVAGSGFDLIVNEPWD